MPNTVFLRERGHPARNPEQMRAGCPRSFRAGSPQRLGSGRHPKHAAGFSLIEVVIALGIISFALVAVIGLLPTGLNSQRQAVNQAFGVQALNDVAQGIQGIYTATNGTVRFGSPLADVTVGQGSSSLYLLENGTLTSSSDPTSRGRVFIDQKALVGSLRPVFISVAWPQTADRSGGSWANSQGSVSAFLYLPQ